MTIRTNYFDDTSYSTLDAVAPWASMLADGVFDKYSGALDVSAHSPANLSVDVAAGSCVKSGYYVKSDATENVAIASNTSGYNRIDSIVVDVDTTNKVSTIMVVQGTPSSSPVAPTLTGTKLLLANVLVGNNVSVLDDNVITDMRMNADTYTQQNDKTYRQALINANFDVWQEGTSFTNPGYSADQWTHMGSTNTTVSRQSFTVGQTDVPNNPKYFMRVARTPANAAANTVVRHVIEGVRKFAGGKASVGFWAKGTDGKVLKVYLKQSFGTGGSPSSEVNTAMTSITLTSSWAYYKATFDVPSISGKTIGNDSNDSLQLVILELSDFSIFTFDIAQAQMNYGAVVLPFCPKNICEELQDCQRFYEKSYDPGVYPDGEGVGGSPVFIAYDANVALGSANFKVTKRTVPTITLYDPNGGQGANTVERAGIGTVSGVTASRVGMNGFSEVDKTAGWATNNKIAFQYVANARI